MLDWRIAVALLVLSIRLWGKLFFIKHIPFATIGSYVTPTTTIIGVLVLFASYYLWYKIIIFKIVKRHYARQKVPFVPGWTPIFGNYFQFGEVMQKYASEPGA